MKRIRCTPNLHTGTGLVERTTRTIESLTRDNLEDGLTFEERVQLAIRTITQTPNIKLIIAFFQMHFGRKPRTAITDMIGQPSCVLSNWKKTVSKYILAQPTEQQVFTIHDADGEMADYLSCTTTRSRSVSKNFKQYQFHEKEDKPNAMKCRFKTNKTLIAVSETVYTFTTADGKIIHKKLASNLLKFQPPKKPDEARKPTNMFRRYGKFSQSDFCETHKGLMVETLKQDEASTSKSFPKMRSRETEERSVITITTDCQTTDGEGNS